MTAATCRVPAETVIKAFENLNYVPDPADVLTESWREHAQQARQEFEQAFGQRVNRLVAAVQDHRELSEPQQAELRQAMVDYGTTRFIGQYYERAMSGKVEVPYGDVPTRGGGDSDEEMRVRLIRDAAESAAEQKGLIKQHELLRTSGGQSLGGSFVENLDKQFDKALAVALPKPDGPRP